ncbi:hypothetical protein AB6A40_005698 [Gnathostoma spinigerum]|uniref:GT23 domain-containing protein n=1 Tax=Gnathostoma spinigerum TaxID=75299 RepID=A0ABD6EG72_9BILA
MLILRHDGLHWNYSKLGWSNTFLPITKCSYSVIAESGDSEIPWSSVTSNANDKVVHLPIVDSLRDRPKFLPLAIPKSLSSRLITLHSYPPVFFISQFMRYLMRPANKTAALIAKAAAKIDFTKGPIVGLQIRRTDKIGVEAAYHSVDEYMKWTERWFKIEEYRSGKPVARKIFIASDDPTVFAEARMNYPNYTVYGDPEIAQSAGLSSRYTIDSLNGIIIDVELLSRCSYLVCTFSSQVCRLGYELMQHRVGDAGDQYHSLDDIYYYGGQLEHSEIAVESYKAENNEEIDLEVGDEIGIAGNHWNGFSKGVNKRTSKVGLYPSYKTIEKWRIVDFPI